MKTNTITLEPEGEFRFRIRKATNADMRTDGLLFLSAQMANSTKLDESPVQVANVATLPGIVGCSLAMPDMHWGYGFPIGGVAAFDCDKGVISPGGVGYDINCGVNLTRTSFTLDDLSNKIEKIVNTFFARIPAGVGTGGGVPVSKKEFDQLLATGARWAEKRGLASADDIQHMEDSGCLKWANPDKVSARARERGYDQVGTLGAGNHFVEIQVVQKIYDEKVAAAFGLFENQICLMVHSGSRGFGYQVCTEYLPVMNQAAQKYGIALADRQLACAPVASPEGKDYLAAMACAANYAFVNRLSLRHGAMDALADVMDKSTETCGFGLVYDVCHNIAKIEKHVVEGKERQLCVHRKGATRSLPAGHADVPAAYRHVGQPVLIPGDMGRASWVLVGTETAMTESFGSAPHGAGRLLSRTQGAKLMRGDDVRIALAEKGIIIQARSRATLAEEQPDVYKNVEEVVRVAAGAGLARPVARLKPLGAIKG